MLDIQLKKGLIEVCVLAALERNDSYGYRLVKDISPLIEVSESTLYPILKRAQSNHWVTFYQKEHNSRLRKYYRITSQGQARIDEFIEQWQDVIKAYGYIKEARGHDESSIS